MSGNYKGKGMTLKQEVEALHLHNKVLTERCKRADDKAEIKGDFLDECIVTINESDRKYNKLNCKFTFSVISNVVLAMWIFAMLFGSR